MDFTKLEALNQIALAIFSTYDINRMADGVMATLPALVTHDKSFFTCSAIGSRKRRTNIRSLTLTKEEQQRYIDRYEAADYTTWYLNQQQVHVYRDTEILTKEVIHQTDIYRDWIAPMGMEYLCGVVARSPQARYAELTLMRSAAKGDYSDEEIRLLSLVVRLMDGWFEQKYSVAYASLEGEEDTEQRGRWYLTRREEDVVRLICAGLSTHEISEHLSIANSTTRRHIANIYQKMAVTTRVELIRKYKG